MVGARKLRKRALKLMVRTEQARADVFTALSSGDLDAFRERVGRFGALAREFNRAAHAQDRAHELERVPEAA
jgi:hypothetical protein